VTTDRASPLSKNLMLSSVAMKGIEWSKGKRELGLPSPNGVIGTLKTLLEGLPPRRHRALTIPSRIPLGSESSKRSLVAAATNLEKWKAQAYESHQRTLIR